MRKWEVEAPKGVVVMVHGAAEHHGRYTWLIERWNANGFHVIMGDLPGQGTTSRRVRGHIQSFQDYINTVENWINHSETYNLPIFLLGHSMGGLAVIRTLQEKSLPIDGVILSSPCLGLMKYPPLLLEWLSRGLNIAYPSLRMDSKLSSELATRNKEIHAVDANDTLYVKKVSVRWYRELVAAMEHAFDKMNRFPDVPILLMQSGDDKIVDKTLVKKWFDALSASDKTYKEWKVLYHEIFNEPERDEVFDFALAFITTHIGLKPIKHET
ncbi:alpha/beta hydrolase [Bacillus timonensis]|nr:alpha/beta hydrolase [Bacillus timonensis]